jgi:hypothetical protein
MPSDLICGILIGMGLAAFIILDHEGKRRW